MINSPLKKQKQNKTEKPKKKKLFLLTFVFSLEWSTWCVLSRHLSSAQTKAALKPFYFAVHPDLFGQYPLQRVRIFIYIFFCFWSNVYIKELYICNLCTKEDKLERRSSLKMWHSFSFHQWKAITMITVTSTVTHKLSFQSTSKAYEIFV